MEHTPHEIKNYVDNNWYRLSLRMDSVDNTKDEYEIKKELIEYFTKFPEQITKMSPKYVVGPKQYHMSLNNIGGTMNKYM